MYKWKPYDINNPFKTRQGESIADLDMYVGILHKNNISFSEEQYKEAKKEIDIRTSQNIILKKHFNY